MPRSIATVALLVFLITLYGCRFDTEPGTTAATPADSAAGEVSFELEGQGGAALVVPVHINDGGPFDFVLQQLDLRIDGLIGLNFLKEFQIMLDFDRQIVRFGP